MVGTRASQKRKLELIASISRKMKVNDNCKMCIDSRPIYMMWATISSYVYHVRRGLHDSYRVRT